MRATRGRSSRRPITWARRRGSWARKRSLSATPFIGTRSLGMHLVGQLGRARLLSATAVAAMLLCCCANPPAATPTATAPTGPTATAATSPTATPQPSPSGLRTPQGYVLPAECRFVDSGTVDGSATTWKISCPQGLPSSYLRPSLTAQGWVTCGTNVWQKASLQTSVIDAVNVSGFTGWLDQRPLSGGGCSQPTPPPDGSASPP
jgi:hypothetical protein